MQRDGQVKAFEEVRSELRTVGTMLPAAMASFESLERFLEDALVNDTAMAQSDRKSAESIKAYGKSLETTPLDVISGLIDLTSGLKGVFTSGSKLVKELRAFTTRNLAKKIVRMSGQFVDAASSGKSAVTGGAAVVASSDAMPPAVQALTDLGQRVSTVRDGLALVQRFTTEQAQIGVVTQLEGSTIAMERVLNNLPRTDLTDPRINDVIVQVEQQLEQFNTAGTELGGRLQVLQAIAKARGSKGVEGLEKGAPGRDIFEQLVLDKSLKEKSTLTIQHRYEVDNWGGEMITRASGYLLSVADEDVHEAWADSLPAAEGRGLRLGGNEEGVWLPASLGAALVGVVEHVVELPPHDVRLNGKDGPVDTSVAKYLHFKRDYQDEAFPTVKSGSW